MTDKTQNPVECGECGEQPTLVEQPYETDADYVLTCDCEFTELDVSACLRGKNVLEPLTGKWSTLNDDV